MIDWIRNTMLAEKFIGPEDLDLVQVVDEPEAIVETIFRHYEHRSFSPSPSEREILLNL
jgi:predicted Rossmann-fold nucleotide-binding protein